MVGFELMGWREGWDGMGCDGKGGMGRGGWLGDAGKFQTSDK